MKQGYPDQHAQLSQQKPQEAEAFTGLLADTPNGVSSNGIQETAYKFCHNLQIIPGLSVSSALTILSEIGDISYFDNYRSFLNYAGLAPTIHASGEQSRIGRINRKSNTFLRTAFYQAGKSIATNVKEKSELKDLAGRMLVRYGKGKRTYMKIAAKVARIVYSLLKKGEWYNPFHGYHETREQATKVIKTRIDRKKKSFRRIAN